MKYVITLVILLVLQGILGAQTRNSILVYSNSTFDRPPIGLDLFADTVRPFYKGNIVKVRGVLPDSLDRFDAIAITDYTDLDSNSLDKLKPFIKAGKKLYLESSILWTKDAAFDSLIGIYTISPPALEYRVDSIHGVKSTFTEGMHYYQYHEDPLRRDLGGILYVDGTCTPVLFADNGAGPDFAFTNEVEGRRVVIHLHELNNPYFQEFAGRVLCNYFQLCEPLAVRNHPTSSASISYENMTRTIHYSGADNGKAILSVFSLLGTKIWESKINGSLQLPASITVGSYIVSISEGGTTVTDQKIVVY